MDSVLEQLEGYHRILILGSPGSGKTTLSHRLARLLALPMYSMDDLYWQKNWRRPPPELWQEKLKTVLNKDKWILEGNYLRDLPIRLERAQVAVVLESNPLVCLLRCMKRGLARRRGQKHSLPKAVRNDTNYHPHFSIPIHFVYLVSTFNFKVMPKMNELLKAYNTNTIKINYKALRI